MGPPPHQPQARPAPPPIRPGAGWYSLPLTLILLPLLLFVVVFALNWRDSEAADGPSAAGDARAGVNVELTSGHTYFLYVRTGAASPTSCALAAGGDPVPVPLTREHGWSASDRAGYRYASTFEAPLSGRFRLVCAGVDGQVLMQPDDTSYGYLGLAFLAVVVAGGTGAVMFIVIAVMRSSSAKRRRAALSAPPAGPYGTPY
ncbi:hypothetical protein GCM10010191_15560 [Actinomadura vinacea]|uniref:Integral membrane protein n=1 Tax=Actinomadura vinacea TaxID=115336 RepID=A0ABP5VPT8_9ACTN